MSGQLTRASRLGRTQFLSARPAEPVAHPVLRGKDRHCIAVGFTRTGLRWHP